MSDVTRPTATSPTLLPNRPTNARQVGNQFFTLAPDLIAVSAKISLATSIQLVAKFTGDLAGIIKKIEQKEHRKLPFGAPRMQQLLREIKRIAKTKLSGADARKVEKAITYDPSAPFTITELHGFVHQSDLPSARDILQFWKRTEPLFRLMLEQDHEDAAK